MISGRALVWAWLAFAGALLVVRAVGASMSGDEEGHRGDIHSYARPGLARVTHVALDLAVDFHAKVLKGSATLTFERPPGAPADAPLVLDTKGLVIEGVTRPDLRGGGAAQGVGQPVPFEPGKNDPILGAPLSITLPADATSVRIAYHTTADSTALQWLTTRDSNGRLSPFLFTQSQAIHARSWIPLQDSPAVRVTYEATIRVPELWTPVMSAEHDDPPGIVHRQTVYRFRMSHPIPPYLIALAVGDLSRQELGPRTGVVAGPGVIKAAAQEFADTETMVKAAEARYGPYRWGRYNLLILPPSFPFGGMENPMLTFATPTVIAGDKSLVSLVAHELAHSWSGNLVTNATWSDFWLNEGFTTYIERRIIEDLYGTRRAAMERVLGMRELRDELKSLPPRDQVLHVDLAGRDPDEGMTRIPYEKGALFLTTLEQAFGRARFDAFLRAYFDHFAFQSITTKDFRAYLRAHLFTQDEAAAQHIDLDAWIEQPGLPEGYPEPDASAFAPVDAAASDWSAGRRTAAQLDATAWSTQEWLRFLQSLPATLDAGKMAELDGSFHLTDRGNAEVACQWLTLAVRHGYKAADARLDSFLTTIGRRKFLMPLYTELLTTPAGGVKARALFAKARPFYHPIAVESVEKLLSKKPPQEP